MRCASVVGLVELGMLVVLGACFHPSFDRPECGANGECPPGLTCSAMRVCDVAPPAVDGATPIEAPSIEVLAGVVSRGSTDDAGAAARFYKPAGVTVDATGNLYVADTGNHTIRKVTAAGVVTTLAGTPGISGGEDGTGGDASFNGPGGVAVDSAGNVYVADTHNNAIRKITPAGVVTTLAGSIQASGYVNGTGSAARFLSPSAIAIDTAGTLYVTDQANFVIRKVSPAGAVTTLAGTGVAGTADGTGTAASFGSMHGITLDRGGVVYIADASSIRKITPAGVVTTLTDTAGVVTSVVLAGITVDASGNLYGGNGRILKITPAGVVTTVAGGLRGSADGIGSLASFDGASGIALDSAGTLYVADSGNNAIRKVTAAGLVTTLAGLAGGSVDGLGSAARFRTPNAIAVDGAGNAYVTDQENNNVRKITPAGQVTTVTLPAGSRQPIELVGIAVDGAGDLYIADEAQGIIELTPAGGSAMVPTGSTRIDLPGGLEVDPAGTIYVTDELMSTVIAITAAGAVSTVAGTARMTGSTDGTGADARFLSPRGIALDGDGNLYVADLGNSTIRKITPLGVVTTLAGTARMSGTADGTGADARFSAPSSIAADTAGNVYIANGTGVIRKVTPDGVASTIALDPAAPGFLTGLAVVGDSLIATDDTAVVMLRHFAR
jgi:sugar lactone lactonase YvrE